MNSALPNGSNVKPRREAGKIQRYRRVESDAGIFFNARKCFGEGSLGVDRINAAKPHRTTGTCPSARPPCSRRPVIRRARCTKPRVGDQKRRLLGPVASTIGSDFSASVTFRESIPRRRRPRLESCRKVLRGHDSFLNQQVLERREPALVVAPGRIFKIVRSFPLADRGYQLLPEIFPIEVTTLRKSKGDSECLALPGMAETQSPVQPWGRVTAP
jgi:hypothetical protein